MEIVINHEGADRIRRGVTANQELILLSWWLWWSCLTWVQLLLCRSGASAGAGWWNADVMDAASSMRVEEILLFSSTWTGTAVIMQEACMASSSSFSHESSLSCLCWSASHDSRLKVTKSSIKMAAELLLVGGGWGSWQDTYRRKEINRKVWYDKERSSGQQTSLYADEFRRVFYDKKGAFIYLYFHEQKILTKGFENYFIISILLPLWATQREIERWASSKTWPLSPDDVRSNLILLVYIDQSDDDLRNGGRNQSEIAVWVGASSFCEVVSIP